MTQIAKFFQGATVVPAPVGAVSSPLPVGSVWLAPGFYTYDGVVYDCREEGLYRFVNASNGTAQNRISIKSGGQADLYKVLSGVCWNHVHGSDDNGVTDYQAVSNAGMTRKWRSQCGYISGLMAWALPLFGYTSRTRNPSTTSAQNGWDDGHIVLETQHGSDWRMWDMTNACYFRNTSGKHLSTAEVVSAVNGGVFDDLTKVVLCPQRRFNSDTVGGIDLSIYGDMVQLTEAEQTTWYKRVFQQVS